ncbi:MAG: 30S ribosomal protein S12 methylthiotransferase RimO [Oscillospiraceae bacterium]|jgi:ribosomal protein S12 methylthiotransferase|nr:30S ribosomal protein S12 methylthiotransferase RimO [Oscillospiraceae bacterium]
MAIFKKKKEGAPAQAARRTVAFVCLGCPKNQVNAERMMADLEAAGFALAESVYNGADAVIVNTCAFIDDAKREAVDSILEMAELKKNGVVKKVIVAGCLAQGHREEIAREIPEADAVLGLGANGDIARHVEAVLAGETLSEFPDLACLPLGGPRKLTSPAHWAYLQVADGCDNRCAYCKIPDLRGSFRSRPMEDILEEARLLVGQGARELVLVAQDTTRWGLDLYGKLRLPDLLRALCEIDDLRRVRLLYCYPDEVTGELVETMASEPKIAKYIDLPLQHIDDRVLKAMGRRGNSAQIRALLNLLREKIPGVAIRTTFITGFPGEDEAAFEALSAFVEEQRFAHMGVFAFSPQEGTRACELPNQVEPETAQLRAQILTQQQAEIAMRLQEEAVGQVLGVIVDEYDPYTDSFLGRGEADAPEIDGMAVFTSRADLRAGDLVQVEIFDGREDVLLGRAV